MRWQNWGRTEAADPVVLTPVAADDIVAAVQNARRTGTTVKAAGSGHSFSGIAVPGDVFLDLRNFRGIRRVNGEEVTFAAGTHLHEIPGLLAPLDLAMENLGDIDRQTLAGAISTGTHGTGLAFGGISTQVTELTLIDGTGTLRTVAGPQVQAAAVGLGALGILTEITVRCVPAFSIEATESPADVADVLAELDESIEKTDHFEFYWFPHTAFALTKRNRRVGAAPKSGPSKLRRYIDDELLSNTFFGGVCGVAARFPQVVPAINKVSGRALSGRTYVDQSHKVFTSSRRVRFREMEYAVPLEKLAEAFDGVREVIAHNDYRVSFPIEVRAAAADDLMLSTASGRASGYVAVHRYFRGAKDRYFDDVEAVMTNLGGRPHWGKMHTQDADYLRSVYPRFDDFISVRNEFDPDRVFRNSYLNRVLG